MQTIGSKSTIHIQCSKTRARARTGDKTPNDALIELQPVRVLFAKLQNAKLRLFTASTQHFSTSAAIACVRTPAKPQNEDGQKTFFYSVP